MLAEKTILVVEDSDEIRETLRQFLLFNGYRVAEAINGHDAVEFVRRKCPDLILLDLNLPLMDGLRAAQNIRRRGGACARVPILAITAFDTYGMREAAIEAGCTDYILKPLDLIELEKTISSILAERRVKMRIAGPLPVRVRLRGRDGEVFKADSIAENISTDGIYLRLGRQVETGTELLLVVQFSRGLTRTRQAARVAARGVVLRVEPAPGGSYGVAIEIRRHRFL